MGGGGRVDHPLPRWGLVRGFVSPLSSPYTRHMPGRPRLVTYRPPITAVDGSNDEINAFIVGTSSV